MNWWTWRGGRNEGHWRQSEREKSENERHKENERNQEKKEEKEIKSDEGGENERMREM